MQNEEQIVQTNMWLPVSTIQRIKIIAVQRRSSMRVLVAEALKFWLEVQDRKAEMAKGGDHA